jgi:hypothetical protein
MMMASRVIPPNFDYQPLDIHVLNWDETPPAPDDFECVLEWNYKGWDKSYGGLVWAPAVRDALFDNFGLFGTFRTPLLLDQAGFRKLCYLVAGEDTMEDFADGKYDRRLFGTSKLPKNYLPFDYCDDSLGWAWRQFRIRESDRQRGYIEDAEDECLFHLTKEGYCLDDNNDRSKGSRRKEELVEDDLFVDAAGQLVKSNDQVRLVNYSETDLNGTIGTVYYLDPQGRQDHVTVYFPSISDETAISISIHNLLKFILSGTDLPLVAPRSPQHIVDWSKMPPERDWQGDDKELGICDLSTDVNRHIASYLRLFDVEHHLRQACRDTFWNFQKPPPDKLEYDFIYFYGSNDEDTQWHGVAHTTNDIFKAIKDHDWDNDTINVSLRFIKFDRNHYIVPLFNYECVGQRHNVDPAKIDPLGSHYFGVAQASHVELDNSIVFLDDLDDPEQIEHTCVFPVFRYCKDWTPREPRIQLRHLGTRKTDCEECGHAGIFCRCDDALMRPGGESGNDYRIYYSPAWFEENRIFAFSAPSDSRDKTVILFSNYVSLW